MASGSATAAEADVGSRPQGDRRRQRSDIRARGDAMIATIAVPCVNARVATIRNRASAVAHRQILPP